MMNTCTHTACRRQTVQNDVMHSTPAGTEPVRGDHDDDNDVPHLSLCINYTTILHNSLKLLVSRMVLGMVLYRGLAGVDVWHLHIIIRSITVRTGQSHRKNCSDSTITVI